MIGEYQESIDFLIESIKSLHNENKTFREEVKQQFDQLAQLNQNFTNPNSILIIPRAAKNNLDFDIILQVVTKYFKMNEKQLFIRKRNKELVFARKLVCYFCRKYTKESLKSIGDKFKQDHSNVITSIQSIESFLSVREENTLKAVLAIRNVLTKDFAYVKNDIEVENKINA